LVGLEEAGERAGGNGCDSPFPSNLTHHEGEEVGRVETIPLEPMGLTQINTQLPSTQRLVALLTLHFVEQSGGGLTAWDLHKKIVGVTGEVFWRPAKSTVTRVVRGLLAEGHLEGDWVNPEGRRRRPLYITESGRIHLRALREELREPILSGRDVFSRLAAELYE